MRPVTVMNQQVQPTTQPEKEAVSYAGEIDDVRSQFVVQLGYAADEARDCFASRLHQPRVHRGAS
jgi:hypothetical protein